MIRRVSVFALCFLAMVGCGVEPSSEDAGSAKFIQTFLVYYGDGPALVKGDEARLAKFDLLNTDRLRYNGITVNGLRGIWDSVRSINPGIKIFLYQMGPEVSSYDDDQGVIYLNNLGRYNVTRNHSMGSLNGNQPALFVHDASGARAYNYDYSDPSLGHYWYLMDFGSPEYTRYWLEAIEADIIRQPWVVDGVFADNCLAINSGGYATPAKYLNVSAWSAAMNGFVQALAAGLQKSGQKMWANRGQTHTQDGFNAWLALDQSGNAPYVVMDEGSFAVAWGEGSDTQFYPEVSWRQQVDILGKIQNSRVAYLSHTDLGENEQGVDNYNRPVTFWQTMWYALGSFLLGKDDARGNAYFMFHGGTGYSKIWWFEEYEKIDFGRANGPYQILAMGGTNIYRREFEFGYIYVNPTANDVDDFELPEPSKPITHDNLSAPLSAIPNVTRTRLPAHHAAFFRKDLDHPNRIQWR